MSTNRIKELEEELRENHITRIHDTAPGLSYFRLMKREMEIHQSLKALRPEEPLEQVQKHTLWSEADVKFLRDFYPEMTDKQLAAQLDRTVNAVRSKVKLLGLKKND